MGFRAPAPVAGTFHHRAAGADDGRGRRGSRGDRPAEIGRATSELQSRQYLVCRLLLEKKKQSSQRNRRRQKQRPRQPTARLPIAPTQPPAPREAAEGSPNAPASSRPTLPEHASKSRDE